MVNLKVWVIQKSRYIKYFDKYITQYRANCLKQYININSKYEADILNISFWVKIHSSLILPAHTVSETRICSDLHTISIDTTYSGYWQLCYKQLLKPIAIVRLRWMKRCIDMNHCAKRSTAGLCSSFRTSNRSTSSSLEVWMLAYMLGLLRNQELLQNQHQW